MKIKEYIRGNKELYKAVWLNIFSQLTIMFIAGFAVNIGILPKFALLDSGVAIAIFCIYAFLILSFDYIVWMCARNAKNRLYMYLGRIFSLRNVVVIGLYLVAPYI